MSVANWCGFRGIALSRRSFPVEIRGAVMAAACAFGLVGCIAEGAGVASPTFGPKHLQPVPAATVALIAQKGMDTNSPILLRIFKEESELEIWKQARDGKYALLKTYPICKWSGELGPKIKEGDRQAPEGFYAITPELMNPRSSYYLSFNLGYPNEFDRAHGRTGAHLMVHGDCSSRGCYAMTDDQIMEIYALSRDSFDGGQLAFQVQAFPFRMTAKNMARHRKNPHMAFWRMLKEGSDHFELTKQQPKIDVCEKRYVFNAHLLDPSQPFDAKGKCPEYEIPESVAVAATEKRKADDRETAFLANLVPAAPIVTGRDGGTHQAFSAPPDSSERLAISAPAKGPEVITGSTTQARSVPTPQASPRRSEPPMSASLNGTSRRAAPVGGPAPRPAERVRQPDPEQEASPPSALPGATPIRAAGGGFSFQ
jgi:murein L,D-transpeptidase YafK